MVISPSLPVCARAGIYYWDLKKSMLNSLNFILYIQQ